MTDSLLFVPLGGVGEIGKNMSAVQCGDDIIVIDTGLMFPDEEMPGVDIVIPDITWLTSNADKVRGICLTHGHEDHIGGLPYVLRELDVPVYGTRLTLGLVRPKLAEHKLSDAGLHEVAAGDRVPLGCIEVEFIRVSHSIPDACSLAIRTPAGTIVMTSDFKFDPMPVDHRYTDIARFAEIGDEGVLAMMSDCTNIEKEGHSQSESVLSRVFERIFSEAQGRIICTSFASNIHRIQQIANLTVKYDRQMSVVGRSMAQNVRTARELGYLNIPDWALLEVEKIPDREPEKVVIMTTGSQGEPLSVLTRISNDDHRRIKIQPGDTVVISAKPVPGNESLVHRVINNLFRRGARVIYDDIEPVHVSGHANKEDLRMMLNLVRPKFVVPVHGEARHLHLYSEMALETGYLSSDVILLDVGDKLELTADSAAVVGGVEQSGMVMVDGLGVGDVGDAALRDRGHLASDGVLVVVSTVDQVTGDLLDGPSIMSRGFMDEEEEFLSEAADAIRDHLRDIPKDAVKDIATARLEIRNALARFVNARTRRRPVIIPVVTEI